MKIARTIARSSTSHRLQVGMKDGRKSLTWYHLLQVRGKSIAPNRRFVFQRMVLSGRSGGQGLAALLVVLGELGVGLGDGGDFAGDTFEIAAGNHDVQLVLSQARVNTVTDASGTGYRSE